MKIKDRSIIEDAKISVLLTDKDKENCFTFSSKNLEELQKLIQDTGAEELCFSDCKIKKESILALMSNSQIKKLTFDACLGLRKEDMSSVIKSIANNQNLTDLCFKSSNTDDDQAKLLINALAENRTLKKIEFSFPGFDQKGGEIIAQGLKKNNSLQTVILQGVMCSPVSCKGVYEAAMTNKNLLFVEYCSEILLGKLNTEDFLEFQGKCIMYGTYLSKADAALKKNRESVLTQQINIGLFTQTSIQTSNLSSDVKLDDAQPSKKNKK